MTISRQDVDHIAHLARLGLSSEEKDRLQDQLSAILDHMRALNELDTAAISPTAQVIPLQNVMRDDEVRPSLPREAVLANAPDRDANFLKVPPVLD